MTDEEKSVARALLAAGHSVAEVSQVTGFSRRTIGRLNVQSEQGVDGSDAIDDSD